jgi:hypothetical protein
VRDPYNVDWVFAFQNYLRETVTFHIGEVEEWPFLKGLRFEAYGWQDKYLILIIYSVSEDVVTSGPEARTPLRPEQVPQQPPSIENIEEWQQRVRQALHLTSEVAVLLVPLSDEPSIEAEWESWDDVKRALWRRQINLIFFQQLRRFIAEGRNITPVPRTPTVPIQSRAYRRHPLFQEPDDLDAPLWRYMSFTKYVSLLETRSLYFSRADQLGDPYEGSTSSANLQLRPSFYGEEAATKMGANYALLAKMIRAFTFVSCWYMSTYESAAMWSLYSDGGPSVAVQTTFRRLLESIQDDTDIYCGLVTYIDYKTEWMPEGNMFYPFMHKRRSYEHEREVRAVFQDWPENFEEQSELNHSGRYVAVDLPHLMKRVYIAPAAPSWFEGLVQAVTRRYGLPEVLVTQSELNTGPVY